ncbi:16S rRNA (guanine(527)-N(7))-methyltransferase RsmG [candidate division TM6 bacterium RIFCSPHIGHO2_12_FULL_38_8]|nr:MAG: 16S rRNA (guanine(527)-N(7))-methyltransferase RsmG [candidate division TM6 bacterium RIFCSPHIGHO2_12_FULL_38_8]
MINQEQQTAWNKIGQKYQINSDQSRKFLKYLQLLLEENQKYNLTAITKVEDVMLDHFDDSLSILQIYDMKNIQVLVDVGSGAGFPGLALAIMLPEVACSLIEVNLKKVNFLKLVIEALGLKNVTVCSDDWRTFLRSGSEKLIKMDPRLREDEGSEGKVDLVVARASLHPDELLRMFKPSSALKTATLVYWASKKWIPTAQEKEYLESCVEYGVGQKQRKLCFFKNK